MMTLFQDTELFDSGKRYRKDFSLPNAGLILWEQFIEKADSDRFYRELLNTSPFIQCKRWMYDAWVSDPRLTAYYGGERGHAWTPLLLDIKAKVEAECGIHFDRVLINYYRDGNDSVAWHADTLPSDGKHHHIASVTEKRDALKSGLKNIPTTKPCRQRSYLHMAVFYSWVRICSIFTNTMYRRPRDLWGQGLI